MRSRACRSRSWSKSARCSIGPKLRFESWRSAGVRGETVAARLWSDERLLSLILDAACRRELLRERAVGALGVTGLPPPVRIISTSLVDEPECEKASDGRWASVAVCGRRCVSREALGDCASAVRLELDCDVVDVLEPLRERAEMVRLRDSLRTGTACAGSSGGSRGGRTSELFSEKRRVRPGRTGVSAPTAPGLDGLDGCSAATASAL
jgi:hypothetical protein